MAQPFTFPPNPDARVALQELRARAERRRQLVAQSRGEKTAQEVTQLLQELQAQQQELEVQYEELLLAQQEAELLRAQCLDLYDFAPVGYCTLRPDGTITQLNLHASQLLGTVRQRLLGRRFGLFVPPAERSRFAEFLSLVLHSGQQQTCELEMRRDNGAPFYAQCIGRTIEPPAGLAPTECHLALLDITSRHEAARALATSETRFRTLFEHSADAVLLIRNRHILDCNQAALQMIGAARKEEVVGQPVHFGVPETQPDGRNSQLVIRQNEETLKKRDTHQFEWFRYTLQGEPMWLEITLTNITVNGEPLIHVVWRDITKRRAADEQLLAEKEFTQSLLESSIDGIVALDRAGLVTAWNSQAARYFGLPAAGAIGRPLFEVLPHLDTDHMRRIVERVLSGELVLWEGQSFPPHRTGHYDAYHVPLRARPEAEATGVLILFRDVTERTRLAEEATRLRLSQQQEVLSAILTTQEAERKRIAEALHNGVGQLLYATKLHLERASATARRDKSLSLLDDAIKMTRSISFELTPGILEDFGLQYALEELVRRIPRASLKAHLHLQGLELPLPSLLELAIYRMVQELFNNILKHAHAQEAFIHVVREGNQLAISVEDNGTGFDLSQARESLTGIGLPGIRNRVGLLGGTLAIDSRPGKGTIVSIELPVKR